jgi:hypothetical protein
MTNHRFGARAVLLALAAAGLTTIAAPAFAQAPNECQAVAPMMQERASLMKRAESFRKKKPTPTEACNVFTSLQKNGTQIVPWVETNGAWCHVPPEFLTNLKQQQEQISKVRTQACAAMAQEKKMIEQAKRGQAKGAPGPLGGGDEIVGGPIKMPQGAL